MTTKTSALPAPLPNSPGTDEAQLLDHFAQLDGYGRRVALAMICSLVRLGAARLEVSPP